VKVSTKTTERRTLRKGYARMTIIAPIVMIKWSWGPLQIRLRRVFYPDGNDWMEDWSVGTRLTGFVSFQPPGWLVDAMTTRGWIRRTPIGEAALEAQREHHMKMLQTKPWAQTQT